MVAINNTYDIKRTLGIPSSLYTCHTAKVGAYFIEGHIPAEDIKRLLKEKPNIRGLIVPGMPTGSPGMEGGTPERYDVLSLDQNGKVSVYSRH